MGGPIRFASDDSMSAAVLILADHDGLAAAHVAAKRADVDVDKTYSELFQTVSGTMDERKAKVLCHPDYLKAKRRAIDLEGELLKRKHADVFAKEMCELRKNDDSNIRHVEKIR